MQTMTNPTTTAPADVTLANGRTVKHRAIEGASEAYMADGDEMSDAEWEEYVARRTGTYVSERDAILTTQQRALPGAIGANQVNTEIRIYVASLADYNAGALHGVWIDCAGKDASDLQAEISAMLRESAHPNVMVACPDCDGQREVPSAEEWAIHDYESPIPLTEYESLDTIATLSEVLDDLGDDDDCAAFAAWYANESATPTDAKQLIESFRDAYLGTHRTLADWAESFVDETDMLHDVPENLRFYFDFERYARDCELGGDVWTADVPGGVAVFNNH